jgi:hypothetical protein
VGRGACSKRIFGIREISDGVAPSSSGASPPPPGPTPRWFARRDNRRVVGNSVLLGMKTRDYRQDSRHIQRLLQGVASRVCSRGRADGGIDSVALPTQPIGLHQGEASQAPAPHPTHVTATRRRGMRGLAPILSGHSGGLEVIGTKRSIHEWMGCIERRRKWKDLADV